MVEKYRFKTILNVEQGEMRELSRIKLRHQTFRYTVLSSPYGIDKGELDQ